MGIVEDISFEDEPDATCQRGGSKLTMRERPERICDACLRATQTRPGHVTRTQPFGTFTLPDDEYETRFYVDGELGRCAA